MKNPLLIGESSVSYSYDFNSHHLVANRPEVVPQIDIGLAERTKCTFTQSSPREFAQRTRTLRNSKRLTGLCGLSLWPLRELHLLHYQHHMKINGDQFIDFYKTHHFGRGFKFKV